MARVRYLISTFTNFTKHESIILMHFFIYIMNITLSDSLCQMGMLYQKPKSSLQATKNFYSGFVVKLNSTTMNYDHLQFYSAVHVILSRFYPDFLENSLYPNFILILSG